MVKAQLRRQGITQAAGDKIPFVAKPAHIKPADIALFTRQMATMLKAGIALLQAFDIIGEGFDNRSMRELVQG
jgi:type IV pilus assembly protein PilC